MRKVSGSGLTIEEQHILEAGTGGTNNEIVSLDIRLSPNTVQTIGSVSHSWSSLVDAVMSS
jgi:DNA-binding NarL/FixJ family response regulator